MKFSPAIPMAACGLLFSVLAGCQDPLPRPEVAQIRAAIKEGLAVAEGLRVEERDAIKLVDAAAHLPTESGPCPIAVEAKGQGRLKIGDRMEMTLADVLHHGPQKTEFTTLVFNSARHKHCSSALKSIEWDLDQPDDGRGPEILAQARDLAREDYWDYELVFVRHKITWPRAENLEKFVPGSTEGRLYVWSFSDRRVACAAEVKATNSSSVSCTRHGSEDANSACLAELTVDLNQQAFTSGIPLLKAIPPSKPTPVKKSDSPAPNP